MSHGAGGARDCSAHACVQLFGIGSAVRVILTSEAALTPFGICWTRQKSVLDALARRLRTGTPHAGRRSTTSWFVNPYVLLPSITIVVVYATAKAWVRLRSGHSDTCVHCQRQRRCRRHAAQVMRRPAQAKGAAAGPAQWRALRAGLHPLLRPHHAGQPAVELAHGATVRVDCAGVEPDHVCHPHHCARPDQRSGVGDDA